MLKLTRPYKIAIHVIIILLLIGAIFGISFGIILVDNINNSNHQQSTCNVTNISSSNYTCCSKICNNTIPQCSELLSNQTNGQCCNSPSCQTYEICYIGCNNCSSLNLTVEYNDYISYIQVNCGDQNCINNYQIGSNFTCWYLIDNTLDVDINAPAMYKWYIVFILGLLCFILIVYIILLSVFIAKFNFCI
ncbi:hypothetical protein QKU48_gp0884 [Fadolivirus algeromassiliense]|jgi:hypothetical protein|uniref:Transmembrane protein n=1 Tax=Fadolivirus FV1/VV64 TaxID=3070911 RepID=A0A7D3R1A1_9VIRU|nr:hypothetical protein QKU48_gp0884 [Fadolivirus algeromassiliense]QKF94342.1 hypothetical protein Fadolivirus_1_884 [Fadolivirus FV1/VV64]